MFCKTVNEAIITVLRKEKKFLSAKDIFLEITEAKLYDFKSITPKHIVLTQLRRHCVGVTFKSAHTEKLYKLDSDGNYGLK